MTKGVDGHVDVEEVLAAARELDDALLEVMDCGAGPHAVRVYYDPPWTPRMVLARDCLRRAIGRDAFYPNGLEDEYDDVTPEAAKATKG